MLETINAGLTSNHPINQDVHSSQTETQVEAQNKNITTAIIENDLFADKHIVLVRELIELAGYKPGTVILKNHDELLERVNEINPDIIIAHSGKVKDGITGIELARILRLMGSNALFYLCDVNTDSSSEELQYSNSIGRPRTIPAYATASDIRPMLKADLEAYTFKYKDTGVDYEKIRKGTKNLLHDLVKPVQNAFYIIKSAKGSAELKESLNELACIYDSYLGILRQFQEHKKEENKNNHCLYKNLLLTHKEIEKLQYICDFFDAQYADFPSLLDKMKNSYTDSELQELKTLITYLNSQNNEFSDNTLRSL